MQVLIIKSKPSIDTDQQSLGIDSTPAVQIKYFSRFVVWSFLATSVANNRSSCEWYAGVCTYVVNQADVTHYPDSVLVKVIRLHNCLIWWWFLELIIDVTVYCKVCPLYMYLEIFSSYRNTVFTTLFQICVCQWIYLYSSEGMQYTCSSIHNYRVGTGKKYCMV
jgi:hypothetical protein